MQPSALAEAREWLTRADQDLQAAERLLQTPPLSAIAAYHTQQAGEKALKAFLAAHNPPFRSTHNLLELLQACLALDPTFGPFTSAAQTLTPYATRFRYPGGPSVLPVTEAEEALDLAEDLVRFVRGRL